MLLWLRISLLLPDCITEMIPDMTEQMHAWRWCILEMLWQKATHA